MLQLHNKHELDVAVGQSSFTVRYGNKWRDTPIGAQIELFVTRNDITNLEGAAVVEGVTIMKFRDIPAKLIETQQEASARVYSGLLESMRRAYGSDFSEDSEVICLAYKRTE